MRREDVHLIEMNGACSPAPRDPILMELDGGGASALGPMLLFMQMGSGATGEAGVSAGICRSGSLGGGDSEMEFFKSLRGF